MSEPLLAERDGRLLRLTLNRPEKRNALSLALCEGLLEAIREAEADPGIGAVLIGANGPAFSSGMDLGEAREVDPARQAAVFDELFTWGERARKPLIAAVQGAVLGGGLGLAANAHVVVAAQGATFGLTGIRVGAWPFVLFHAVARAIGERRALELSLSGRVLNTAEALQSGLVHLVAPAFEYDDLAEMTARRIADSSPAAVASALAFVRETRELDTVGRRDLARQRHAEAIQSPDFAEGVQAVEAGRPAIWPSLE